MAQLIKVAAWSGKARLNIVFVHGLGGHPYETWQHGGMSNRFWPVWLSQDISGLNTWTLQYEAAVTNWSGTAIPIQDRAKNVFDILVGRPELKGCPMIFVCHSLGGLVIKQMLRVVNDRRKYPSGEAEQFLSLVRGIVFIATPHTGAIQASLLERLPIARVSPSIRDLGMDNANLCDLNDWYRSWPNAINHKVFYETIRTKVGTLAGKTSSNPGLIHIDPVGIDADHVEICKPASRTAQVYYRTKDFIESLIPNDDDQSERGTLTICERSTIPGPRFGWIEKIALLSVTALIVGYVIVSSPDANIPPDRSEKVAEVVPKDQGQPETSLAITAPFLVEFSEEANDLNKLLSPYVTRVGLALKGNKQILARHTYKFRVVNQTGVTLREFSAKAKVVTYGEATNEQINVELPRLDSTSTNLNPQDIAEFGLVQIVDEQTLNPFSKVELIDKEKLERLRYRNSRSFVSELTANSETFGIPRVGGYGLRKLVSNVIYLDIALVAADKAATFARFSFDGDDDGLLEDPIKVHLVEQGISVLKPAYFPPGAPDAMRDYARMQQCFRDIEAQTKLGQQPKLPATEGCSIFKPRL